MSLRYVVIDTIYGVGLIDPNEVAAVTRFSPKSKVADKPQLVLTTKGGSQVYMVDSRKNCERLLGKEVAAELEPAEGRRGSRARKTRAASQSSQGEAQGQP